MPPEAESCSSSLLNGLDSNWNLDTASAIRNQERDVEEEAASKTTGNRGQCSQMIATTEGQPSTSEEEDHSEDALSHDCPAPSTNTDTFTSVDNRSALESRSQTGECSAHMPKQLAEAETAEASDSRRTVGGQAHDEPQADDEPLGSTAQGTLELQRLVRQHLVEIPEAMSSHERTMEEAIHAMNTTIMSQVCKHMDSSIERSVTLMESHTP
ncbi:uncharacterized protein [Heterodontus francisci]|uniref:uncharacterized protein n=1 Tax=Heterodontus francisci TaxID=7792 RepID=UPI00355B6946